MISSFPAFPRDLGKDERFGSGHPVCTTLNLRGATVYLYDQGSRVPVPTNQYLVFRDRSSFLFFSFFSGA